MPSSVLERCDWARDELSIQYHDDEWGVPLHEEHRLFEFLVLEGAQAGLSWSTILRKRPNYRAAFDGFDPREVARYDEVKICYAFMQATGMVNDHPAGCFRYKDLR